VESRWSQRQCAALQTLNEFQVSISNNSIPRLTLGNTPADELSLCEPRCVDEFLDAARTDSMSQVRAEKES
jgi:hypothetical protein